MNLSGNYTILAGEKSGSRIYDTKLKTLTIQFFLERAIIDK